MTDSEVVASLDFLPTRLGPRLSGVLLGRRAALVEGPPLMSGPPSGARVDIADVWPYSGRTLGEVSMVTTARARGERIEFRTTPEVRRLVERAVEASGTNLTDFAEGSIILAAQRVMADRERFDLPDGAAAEWEAINARPARELPGLRRLMARPSPFDE